VGYEYTQTVEAYEEVTVPAGTYMTFKVKTSNTLGDENVQWWNPDLGLFVKSKLTRTSKSAQGPGTRETELVSYNRGN
jgi:predicted transcriptional regulator YdeE